MFPLLRTYVAGFRLHRDIGRKKVSTYNGADSYVTKRGSRAIYLLKLILLFQVVGLGLNKRNLTGYDFYEACSPFFALNFKMAAIWPDMAILTFFL